MGVLWEYLKRCYYTGTRPSHHLWSDEWIYGLHLTPALLITLSCTDKPLKLFMQFKGSIDLLKTIFTLWERGDARPATLTRPHVTRPLQRLWKIVWCKHSNIKFSGPFIPYLDIFTVTYLLHVHDLNSNGIYTYTVQ